MPQSSPRNRRSTLLRIVEANSGVAVCRGGYPGIVEANPWTLDAHPWNGKGSVWNHERSDWDSRDQSEVTEAPYGVVNT